MSRLAAAALLGLLLAGCLGGSGGGDGGTSETSTSSGPPSSSSSSSTTGPPASTPVIDLLLDFEMAPCTGVTMYVPQQLPDVQALLPDGFTAAVAEFLPGDVGAVAVAFYACANLTTDLTAVPDTFYGQVYTFIERPDGRVPDAPTADQQEYVFRVLAGDDILSVLWPAAGYDQVNGSFDVDVDDPLGLPVESPVFVGQASVGEDYFAQAQAHPGVVTLPGSGTFARYTALADGSVLVWTGRYDLPATRLGEGLLQVPDSDPLAGFEGPTGSMQGPARLNEAGGLLEMDLRRIFT